MKNSSLNRAGVISLSTVLLTEGSVVRLLLRPARQLMFLFCLLTSSLVFGISFNIPEQPANKSLNEFAQQAGQQVLFPYDRVEGISTNALVGEYSLEQGLEILLKSTGLVSVVNESGVLSINLDNGVDQEGNDMTFKKKSRIGVAAFLTATVSGGIQSQALEEVVVTAQKRSESLQDVPIAMQAYTGDQLKNQGISKISDVVQLSPNLNISGQSANNKQINIRGVGTIDFFPNASGAVGVYMDEITMSAPYLTSLGLHDIERVEILRGPQNSLFGRNTTGGAVNFISKLPEVGGDADAVAEITLGNYNRIEVEAAGTLQLGETTALRLAGKSYDRDGVWNDLGNNGADFGEKDRKSLRATLAWEPTDVTTVLLGARRAEEDSDYDPIRAVGSLGTNPDGSAVAGYDYPATGVIDFSQNYTGVTTQGNDPSLAGWENVYITGTHDNIVDANGFNLKVTHDFDFATFTSITSVDDTEVFWSYDTGGTGNGNISPVTVISGSNSAQPLLAIDMDLEWSTFNQEFRLTSNNEGPFRWVAGFFYFQEDSEIMNNIRFGESYDTGGGAYIGATALGGILGNAALLGNTLSFQYAEIDNELWSPYFHTEYDISDKLSLTIGLRYTDDTKEITNNIVGTVTTAGDDLATTRYTAGLVLDRAEGQAACVGNASVSPCVLNITDTRDDNITDEVGGKIGLDYHIDDDTMIFGSYSRGFRGGKQDIEFLHGPHAGLPIADLGVETLDAYELGYKTELLDGSLQLNSSIYFYQWNDQQGFAVGAAGPVLFTIEDSELKGFELEAKWAPSDTWLVQAGFGWQDTEIKSTGPNGFGAADQYEQGHELAFAAPVSANLMLIKDFEVNGNPLSLQMDWAYRSESKAYAYERPPIDELESTSKINIRATYSIDDKYEISLFGENITEEESCQYKWDLGFAGTTYCVANEAAAFYGITGRYHF